jgi:formylglycine-generating enzyme required for sulfatase activity
MTSHTSPTLDFDLEISPGLGRDYPLEVHSSAGEARMTLHFPFDELALESRLKDLAIALLKSGGRRRQALTQEEQAVRDFGGQLFDALLTGEARSRYEVARTQAAQNGQTLRLRLRIIPPELACLPWEFLFDRGRGEYLCLAAETPLVRYIEQPQPIPSLSITPPLRILGMVSAPSDLPELDVTNEKARVEKALAGLTARGLVSLTWLEGATWRDLQAALRPGKGPWHVFHFIGHGSFDVHKDEGLLAFCDEHGSANMLTATAVGRLLEGHKSLRLALLNACESATSGKRDIFSSTAAIINRRLPAVLAMQYEITDAAAVEFARTFYESLADHCPIDLAVTEARKAISIAVTNSLEWGTPVLYTGGVDLARVLLRSRSQVLTDPFDLPIGEIHPLGFKRVYAQHGQQTETITAAAITPQGQRLERKASASVRVTAPPKPDRSPSLSGPIQAATRENPLAGQQNCEDLSGLRVLTLAPGIELPLVGIPAGEFLMGSDPQKDPLITQEETPLHNIYLGDYWIGKTPVTNAQYAIFANIMNKQVDMPKGKDNHPVVNVSWHNAVEFCEWLGKVSGQKVCLPTEAEWEKAARGIDGRIFPWGNEWDSSKCNTWESKLVSTTPVGMFSPKGDSPYSCVDMLGNVWEWTSSLFSLYPYNSGDGRESLRSKSMRVLRGGSWSPNRRRPSCYLRDFRLPVNFDSNIGFRIACVQNLG